MPIALVCGSCDHRCKVADNLAGRKVKCPRCGVALNVPDEEAEGRPAAQNRRRDDDRENRSRPKTGKKGGNKGLVIGLGVGCGVLALLLVVGGVLLFFYFRGGGGFLDSPNATEENFDKIKPGMSKEAVEKILGPGSKVSRAEVFKALHDPLPKEGVGSDALTLKWTNKSDTILLEMHPPPGKRGGQEWQVAHGWFVREQGGSKKPKYKMLGFGKLP